MKQNKTVKKCIIYLRENKDSVDLPINKQKEILIKFAKKNNWVVTKYYLEENENKVFEQMLEDSKKKQFDIVLIYTLKSLPQGTKPYISTIYYPVKSMEILKENNIVLWSYIEKMNTSTPADLFALRMYLIVHAFQYEMLNSKGDENEFSE